MAYFAYKRSGKNRYLVIRWKKRINGIPTIVKEISVGTADDLAKTIEGNLAEIKIAAYNGGSTLCVLRIDHMIGLKTIVNGIVDHHERGMSPGDYFLLFIMNRLSDPASKDGIEKWMSRDYASTIYERRGSQDFWNLMDRITDVHMVSIMKAVREKIIEMGYDFSRIFVDASNMYTFMDENEMAKKGHNKKHRYDLNQISYYIGANYDYIPLFWNSYAGNIHDSRTFPEMIGQISEDSLIIFDRGYNSKSNIDLMGKRRYIGALKQSDHHDIMKVEVEKDSYIEMKKNVYGKDHRIILYHSSSLEIRKRETFMKRMEKVILKTKKIMDSGDSDSMDKARIYLESENLNETIILPSLEIDQKRMDERLSMMGKNAIFTNIMDMDSSEVIDLYKKRNRVEHCFRTINTMGIAFPVYHRTPQKIRVHMFMSLLAYLFLSLIYNEMHRTEKSVTLPSTIDIMKDIMVVYAAKGKKVNESLDFKSEMGRNMGMIMKLEEVLN
ncbi:MAG: transposase [Candidatus Thermoplasmatota archaeon]|nr:transposase [Candidatus Thermoplasmatota archaeon]